MYQLQVQNDSSQALKPSSLIASSNQDNINKRPKNQFRPAVPQRTINEVKLEKYPRKKLSKNDNPKNFSFSKKENPKAKQVDSYLVKKQGMPPMYKASPGTRYSANPGVRIRPLYETPKKISSNGVRLITPIPSSRSKINPLAFNNSPQKPGRQNSQRPSKSPSRNGGSGARPGTPSYGSIGTGGRANTIVSRGSRGTSAKSRRGSSVKVNPQALNGRRYGSLNSTQGTAKFKKLISSSRNRKGGTLISAKPVEVSKHVYFKNSDSTSPARFLNTKGQGIDRKRVVTRENSSRPLSPINSKRNFNVPVIQKPRTNSIPRSGEIKRKKWQEKSIHLKNVETQTSKFMKKDIPRTQITVPLVPQKTPNSQKDSEPIKLFPKDPSKKVLYKKKDSIGTRKMESERSSWDLDTPDYSTYYFKEPSIGRREAPSLATTDYSSAAGVRENEVNYSDYEKYWKLADKVNYPNYIQDSDDTNSKLKFSEIDDSSFYSSPYYIPDKPFVDYVTQAPRRGNYKKSKKKPRDFSFDESARVTPVRYRANKAPRRPPSVQGKGRMYKKPPNPRQNKKREVTYERKRDYPGPHISPDASFTTGLSPTSSHRKYYVKQYPQKLTPCQSPSRYTDRNAVKVVEPYEPHPVVSGRHREVVYNSPERENRRNLTNRKVMELPRKVQSTRKEKSKRKLSRLRGNNTSKKDLIRRKSSQKSVSFRASESPVKSPRINHRWKTRPEEPGFKEYEVPLRKFRKRHPEDDNKEVFVLPSNVYARVIPMEEYD